MGELQQTVTEQVIKEMYIGEEAKSFQRQKQQNLVVKSTDFRARNPGPQVPSYNLR